MGEEPKTLMLPLRIHIYFTFFQILQVKYMQQKSAYSLVQIEKTPPKTMKWTLALNPCTDNVQDIRLPRY